MEVQQSVPEHLVTFAVELAMAARRETLAAQSSASVMDKGTSGTFDPVTSADRAAEATMRAMILRDFPHHGVSGEEFPDTKARGEFMWSLDPIDGTRSYICGLPNWTTLVALLRAGEPLIGVIDVPCLDELYLGAGGDAAIVRKGERFAIRTSGCRRIADARFSTTDPFLFGNAGRNLKNILGRVRVSRFGHDGYAYARLAAGTIDLVIECCLKPHDYNALIPLIGAAGGHIGDWQGGSDFAAGNVIAAASQELYDEAVALVGVE